MIKTETLTANAEKLVEVKDAYAMIENRGTGTVYASKKPNISASADGVLAIDAGNAKVLRNVDGKIYVKSNETGIVEIQTANDLHFFKSRTSKGGGGGEPVDAYTKSQTDALLADKVGKNDFAGYGTGGVVKLSAAQNYANGLKVDNSNYLQISPATADEIRNGVQYKPITPYYVGALMSKYGINSQTQIADMQANIDSKVDNGSFYAENLIVYPYVLTAVRDSLNFENYSDGGLRVHGTRTNSGNLKNTITSSEMVVSSGEIYTLSVASGTEVQWFTLEVEAYKNGAWGWVKTLGVKNNASITFTVEEIWGKIRLTVNTNVAGTYDVTFYPMLEKGVSAHSYQPYKLSRQSLRDDIDALVALL